LSSLAARCGGKAGGVADPLLQAASSPEIAANARSRSVLK